MPRSIRYSVLTIVAVLCLGVTLSGAGLKLPAFSRSVAAHSDAPAVILDDVDDVSGESSAGARALRNVTMQTDKSDYQTGEVIVITGSGWDPGETVTLLLQEEPKIHADRKVSVVADAFGAIFDNQFTQDAHDKPVAFRLIAKGESSGLTTQAALAGNPSADLDQWANLNNAWVNGNLGSSKARYFEGDSIPYRLKFSNLSTTGTRTVTIEWDTIKGGKHALDYITTFNRSVPHVAPTVPGELPINPCAGVTGCNPASYDAETILAAPNGPATQVAGEFRLHGGFITGLSTYTVGASADAPTKITISFTASVGNPVLTWGGHIATRLDWGAANSAVSIPGSPYHTRLHDLDGSGGNQDRSLSADAVIFPASITIIKDVAGGTDSASFSFTTTGPDVSGFSLADNGVANANTKVFSNLATFGSQSTRTITESDPAPNFALTALACSSDTNPSGATSNLGARTTTFVLAEGENVSCTFTNTRQQGTLRVIKHVVNDDGGTLGADAFTLHAKSGANDVAGSPAAGSESGTDYNLIPGIYVVSEDSPPSGYTQTGFSGDCDSGGSVVVVSGATKTCTITNDDQAATLTVIKHVINDNGGTKVASNFAITVTGNSPSPANFNGAEDPGTSVTIGAGAYSVDEGAHDGYTKTLSAGCSGTIANGGSATCTITNDDIIASPAIATEMSWTLEDKAVLTGLRTGSCNAPSAPVTFQLYGPFEPASFDPAADNCGAPPAFTSDAMSISDAAGTGASFAVSEPGIYLWVVVYQGDDCNAPTTTACGSERTEIKEDNSIPPPPD
jgi:hypothetical protein